MLLRSVCPSRQDSVLPLSMSVSSTPDATQTIMLNYPSARLSSSPASSPSIIDPPPHRQGSVRPTVNVGTQSGVAPAADFFDDGSSGSEWEDSEGEVTQILSERQRLDLEIQSHTRTITQRLKRASSVPRGRSRGFDGGPMVRPFRGVRVDDSDRSIQVERRVISAPISSTYKARPMSLTRIGSDSVRVVHNRPNNATPRSSIVSSGSEGNSPEQNTALIKARPLSFSRPGQSVQLSRISGQNHHRRDMSESQSVIADSIINAHITTMRALEALNASPTQTTSNIQSQMSLNSSSIHDFPKPLSFTTNRHVSIQPLMTGDHNRPEHLPSHFVKTPYPFSPKKEFPKPDSRPRQHHAPNGLDEKKDGGSDLDRLDSAYGQSPRDPHDDKKGKHVLGLETNQGDLDLHSRLERNEDAQGVIRSAAKSETEASSSVLWVGICRHKSQQGEAIREQRQIREIVVPSSLTTTATATTTTRSTRGSKGRHKGSPTDIEFDDRILAERLQAAHHELAGPWLRRVLSARKLRSIQLSTRCLWSGAVPCEPRGVPSTLLLVGTGAGAGGEPTSSPFTEDGLMEIFLDPRMGRARYTWVHWAQRVAVSNQRAGSSTGEADSNAVVTIVQFVHSLSLTRICVALSLMLFLSVAAAILWIILGPGYVALTMELRQQRVQRVGPGMAFGILVFLVESVVFGVWVCLS